MPVTLVPFNHLIAQPFGLPVNNVLCSEALVEQLRHAGQRPQVALQDLKRLLGAEWQHLRTAMHAKWISDQGTMVNTVFKGLNGSSCALLISNDQFLQQMHF